ncbi:MAG: hypothetical protein ISS69_11160 [Phycisphaerae bacterium]|nr:hypothetical protein [Phycisphaerae bacterium]
MAEFGPVVAQCRSALATTGQVAIPDSAGFPGKVTAVWNSEGPIDEWSDFVFSYDEPFIAQTVNELGSVVFVSLEKTKVGVYVDELIQIEAFGTDAYRWSLEVFVVDVNSQRVVSRTQLFVDPPKHNPPREDEVSQNKKARDLLKEWITGHMGSS